MFALFFPCLRLLTFEVLFIYVSSLSSKSSTTLFIRVIALKSYTKPKSFIFFISLFCSLLLLSPKSLTSICPTLFEAITMYDPFKFFSCPFTSIFSFHVSFFNIPWNIERYSTYIFPHYFIVSLDEEKSL